MAPSRFSRTKTPSVDPAELEIDAWPYLDHGVLHPSRSRRVCITCHWFRHHAAVQCIPLLTCQLHSGLICHGDHLTHNCPRWTEDLTRQQGWAPEAA